MSLFLGIDVGTQGVKALVFDAQESRVVARAASPLELLPVDREGAAEQNPQDWIHAADDAIRNALSTVDRTRVVAVGVSGQQHGFVAMNERQEVIRPAKLWCDTETAPEAEELSTALGRPIPAGFTASKILWLKRHEPQNFADLRSILLPHDYYNWYLTGRAVMEAGDASGTGLFDPVRREFDSEAIAAIDPRIGGCLPSLVGPQEWIGTLRPELAAQWDLSPEVRVAPGSGDNMMSALGAGAIEAGVWVISLGTSGTLFAYHADPVVDPEGMIAPFCDATGAWLPLLCTMNCTTVTEEVRRGFEMSLTELTEAAEEVEIGCEGLTFLPYLAGERAPNWPHATGTLLGIRGASLRPGFLFRAAMEGATFALWNGAQRLRDFGVSASEIRLVGGGSQNPLWQRMIADCFQVPLRFPAEAESAAFGGALQAAALYSEQSPSTFLRRHEAILTEQRIQPDPENEGAYQDAFRRFRQSGQLLFAS